MIPGNTVTQLECSWRLFSAQTALWLQVLIQPAGAIAAAGFVTNAQDKTFQRKFGGQGADDDIVVSSARAYISALSKLASYLAENQLKGAAVPQDSAATVAANEEAKAVEKAVLTEQL